MVETRATLSQDQAQYQQTISPAQQKEAKEKYDEEMAQYEKDLAKHESDTKEYEKALAAYETEVKRQEDLQKAEAKALEDKEKAKAESKATFDLQISGIDAKYQSQYEAIGLTAPSRSVKVPYYYTNRYTGKSELKGYNTTETKASVSAVQDWYRQRDKISAAKSVEVQQATFNYNYPSVTTLGGSWYRDWQKDPSVSLSTRYQNELTRQQTQKQRAREVSIKNAQANARVAAEKYSVNIDDYTKSITNFGGTDIREFSQKELARRSEIKPTPPAAIPTVLGKTLTKADNRATLTGVSFVPQKPALLLRQKETLALSNFYDQYKSTTTPTAPILEGVVKESTGKPVTKETMIKIQGLTAKPETFEYSRAAIYTNKNTGDSFNAQTGRGSIKIAGALGYEPQSQNMQRPETQTETAYYITGIPYASKDIAVPKEPQQKLIDKGIEKSLRVIDNEQSNIDSVTRYYPSTLIKSAILEGAKEGLATLGYVSNVWHEKIQTANFRGEAKGPSILNTKLEYLTTNTGLDKDGNVISKTNYNVYALLGSSAKSIYEGLEGKSTLQFDKPQFKSMEIPNTITQTALQNPEGIPSYMQKYGEGSPAGAAAILLVGGKPSINTPKILLESPTFLKTFMKTGSGSTQVVYKTPLDHLKNLAGKSPKWEAGTTMQQLKSTKMAGWEAQQIAQRTKDWNKLSPLQQTQKLKGRAESATKLKQKFLYERFGGGRYSSTNKPVLSFNVRSVPLGTSLAGAMSKAEVTKPRPLKDLYKDLETKPAARANEIDYSDNAIFKSQYPSKANYVSTKPSKPISESPKAPVQSSTNIFSSTPVKKSRFKSDEQIAKDVKASGGTISYDKSGVGTITKQKTIQKTVQKTTQKQSVKSIQKVKPKQIQIVKPKTKQILKSKLKQSYGLVSLSAQAQLKAQATKQKQKQSPIQIYKQKTAQVQKYKQTPVQKYKFDQAQKLKQKQSPKLKQPLLQKQKLKQPSKLKTKVINPPKLKHTPVINRSRDPTTTKRPIPFIKEFERKETVSKSKGKNKKAYIGNMSEVKLVGVYNRSETIYGKEKVKKLSKRDRKVHAPKKKKIKELPFF